MVFSLLSFEGDGVSFARRQYLASESFRLLLLCLVGLLFGDDVPIMDHCPGDDLLGSYWGGVVIEFGLHCSGLAYRVVSRKMVLMVGLR